MRYLSISEVAAMSDSDRYLLGEIIKSEHQENARRMPIDKYFELFSAEQVLKGLEFDLDPEQIRSGVIGNGGDGGIDSIYLFASRRLVREDSELDKFIEQEVNIEIVILQSKHQASFSEIAVQKMEDFAEKCLKITGTKNSTLETLYNQRLLSAVNVFHTLYRMSLSKKAKLSISFFYTSLGESVDKKVQERADLLSEKCKLNFSAAQVSFSFIGASRLLGLYNRTPTKKLPLYASVATGASTFGTAYICLVPLKNFYNFITKDGNIITSMFESNVRDYQGEVTVNKEIAETLSSKDHEEFWWLNNGVTIIGSEVEGAGTIVKITDPLIVNGLQTSYKLYNHFKNNERGDERNILVRVIQSTDPHSIDKIIKATNSQTRIDKLYLHATETVHRSIEHALKISGLYYDRRKNYYRNQHKPSSKIITMPYLAQAVAAIYLQQPNDARARPTTVANNQYTSLFSKSIPVQLYVKCAQVMRRLDDLLDIYALSTGEKNNLIFYVAMYSTCVTLKIAKPKPRDIADLNVESITEAIIDECFKEVRAVYNHHGGDDRAAKGPRLVANLKKKLEQRFIQPLRVKRP